MNSSTRDFRTEALEAVQELKQALYAHGIILPSLDVDVMTYANVTGRPLVELGRCNQDTAKALADVLRRAAG